MNHDQPVTVSELTLAIKLCLEPPFSHVFLKGEVSNCKRQSSGHLYFSLKDAEAQVGAVMFRGHASLLQRLPKDGDHIQIRGELKVYPPRGNYQVVVKELEYAGMGELLMKLEELKRKIHARGWFSSKHKKPIPKIPKTIGIVTSPTGAAVQDMLHILSRRFGGIHVMINPVKVQGEGAAYEIAKAIEQFNQYHLVDVIIIGRGGGSIEDLWAFNEEVVAEAIFQSNIPIVCAVGHETDHTIAEYVADVRAPTPSAAAELVIAEKAAELQHLNQVYKRLIQTGTHIVRQNLHRLEAIEKHPLLSSPYTLLGQKMQHLDDLRHDLDSSITAFLAKKKWALDSFARQLHLLNPALKIAHFRQQLTYRAALLKRSWTNFVHSNRVKIQQLKGTLQAIDPKNLLKKGYSILFSEKDDSVINSVQSLQEGERVKAMLSDGQLIATVDQILRGDERKEIE